MRIFKGDTYHNLHQHHQHAGIVVIIIVCRHNQLRINGFVKSTHGFRNDAKGQAQHC
jgi:hypothetical protein